MKQLPGRSVFYFLVFILIIIFIQVAIGGITRLTDSGLSMTEWKPIMGSVPPLNAQQWNETFEAYKQIPQYKIVNKGMSLSEFKFIFFWEYLHRMWGRVGFLFIVLGFLYFLRKKQLNPVWVKRFIIVILLYAAQGVLGMFMVKSGLSENIRVSHYRLTAHLLLAISIFAYFAWLLSKFFKVEAVATKASLQKIKPFAIALIILLLIQITYGGFMAGIKAAIHYPSWPLMNDKFVPDNLFFMKPFIKNFGENIATIQFVHRFLAYFLLFAISWFWFKVRPQIKHWSVSALPILLVGQVALGIATLLAAKGGVVSISWGVMHQITGLLLFTNFLLVWFIIKDQLQLSTIKSTS